MHRALRYPAAGRAHSNPAQRQWALIFQSHRFRAACRSYRLGQEFITPYTPEQNGLIERFSRALKEECAWQYNFATFDHARGAIGKWVGWYNEEQPHSALAYQSPRQYWRQVSNAA